MLAINTALLTANLALKTKGENFYKEIDAKSKHSENVLKAFDVLSQEANLDISDIGILSVVLGPGSFTGLRIGTAIAQALGSVNKSLKFVGVSSLELMAYIIAKNKLNKNKNFSCVINALSDLFFVANFDQNGIIIGGQRIIDKSEFLSLNEEVFALKDDLPKYDLNLVELSCEALLEFSELKAQKQDFLLLDEVLPIYLRASQAEDNLKKNK